MGGFALPLPSVSIALAQLVVSAVDWALAGTVLYVLLPATSPPFFTFLSLFLIAILLGMVSHVPGGVGVFEGLMVLLLEPYLASGQLLPPLVVLRAVYYLLPLALALVRLTADEVWQRRAHVARAGAMLGTVTERPLLAAVDCGDRRRVRRIAVAGLFCVQARGLFQRPVVAVRMARRGGAVLRASVGVAVALLLFALRGWWAPERQHRAIPGAVVPASLPAPGTRRRAQGSRA